FVAEFVRTECKVPYTIGKGYHIPAHVGPNTLAIASSYSGNTEETLHAFEQMLARGAKVVVIASGGKLIEKARSLGLDHIQLPSGWPSPRACLGFSLVQQLFVLHKLGLISNQRIEEVRAAFALLQEEQANIREDARSVAQNLLGKIPVIYTTDRMEAVAVRLRQQINENSKMLCWHHVVPEMNHNELVGWRQENHDLAVIYLRNEDDYERNQVRININKEIISSYTNTIIEIYSKGQSLVERALYLVHLSDWISFHLASLRGVDPVEIKVIDYLKSELGKV
ncbi:MAG: bifunctional phosphoglucose/phosphomannose isomerase, partial [Bacteroidota bacterium]